METPGQSPELDALIRWIQEGAKTVAEAVDALGSQTVVAIIVDFAHTIQAVDENLSNDQPEQEANYVQTQ